MTNPQVHLIAWTLVMVVQIAHGRIAARGTERQSNELPLRMHYPLFVHMLIAAAISAVIGYAAQAFGLLEG